MTSERTLPGGNDSTPGSVCAEESSQRKHSETRTSMLQKEWGKHWRRVQLGLQHIESLKRKYGVSMQIVRMDERPCSESEAALLLCR